MRVPKHSLLLIFHLEECELNNYYEEFLSYGGLQCNKIDIQTVFI